VVAVLAVDVAEPAVSVVQGDGPELREQPEAVGPLLVLQGQAPAPPGCEEAEEEVNVMGFIKAVIKNEKVTREGWMCPKCGRVYRRETTCCKHIDKKHGK